MRIVLAFSCFFRLLFGAKLHPNAASHLPDGAPLALQPTRDADGLRLRGD